jgi:hypothetical protein
MQIDLEVQLFIVFAWGCVRHVLNVTRSSSALEDGDGEKCGAYIVVTDTVLKLSLIFRCYSCN